MGYPNNKIIDNAPVFLKFVTLFSWIVIFVVFYFVGCRLYSDWNQIDWENISLRIYFLLPAVLSALCSNLSIALIWKKIINIFGQDISFKHSFRIQFISQIGKYIPGKIGLVFSKFIECRKIGLPGKISIPAASYEIFINLYFQLIICAITFPFFIEAVPWLNLDYSVFLIIFLPLGYLLLRPRSYEPIINFFLSFTGNEIVYFKSTTAHRGVLISFLAALALTNGLMSFFVVNIFYDVSYKHFIFIVGSTAWAFLLGMINLVAPSGIGVREGILVGLFSVFMPSPLALAGAITLRFVSTVVEWILIGCAFCIRPTNFKQDE